MAMPRFLLPTLLSLICGGGAFAADPLTFPWQGRLTVNEIPLTGSHTMVFSLLDSSSTELYNSGSISVQVTEGLAAVLVGGGSMPAIAASVANADGLKMHILLDGTPLSTDIPLVPAFRAHAISDGVVSEAKLDTAAAVKLNALATALSTSTTLGAGAASDTKVPSQLAVKTYVDNAVANGGGGGGGGGATIDTSVTLGSSNAVVPSQLAVKTYVDNGNATLATSVTSEETTRTNADTALNAAITNEASARTTAVAAKLDASALATATDLGTGGGGGGASNAKVPSQLAVKTYVDAAVAGGGVAPDTSIQLGASGSSNTVIPSQLAVKTYVDNATTALATSISNEATARGTAVTNEANLRTSADNALNTAVGLKLDSSALDTTPDLGTSGTPSDTKVPSQHAVKTYIDSAVAAVSGATIADGSVSTQKLADGAVTTVKLGNGAVTLAKQANIADGTILGNNTGGGTAAAPIALTATQVKTLLAIVPADIGGTIGTAQITDASVTTAKVADTNITTAKLADGSVTTAKLADASVTAAKIIDANVTTAKIADGAVTLAKQATIPDATILGNNTGGGTAAAPIALTVAQLKTLLAIVPADIGGTIGTAQITDASITTAKVADTNITTAKLADASVTTAKLADASVTAAKIIDANVTTAKIADGAVTLAKQATIPDATILGNNTGGGTAAAPIALTVAQLKTLLAIVPGDIGGTIGTGQITDASVTTAKIADTNITTAKLADASVATAKIIDGNVTTAKLGDASVTTVKINDGAVIASKLASAMEGRLTWTSIGLDPAPAVVNSGYIVTAPMSITFPDVAAVGDRVRIYSLGGGATLVPGLGGSFNDIANPGVSVTIAPGHSVEVLCVDAGANTWAVIAAY